MFSADSMTLKNPSAAQTSAIAPKIPRPAALTWISSTTLDEPVDRRGRERLAQLLDQVARLVGLAEHADQREREEEERHEGERREVGDHRGEVRPAVGEELREDGVPPHGARV